MHRALVGCCVTALFATACSAGGNTSTTANSAPRNGNTSRSNPTTASAPPATGSANAVNNTTDSLSLNVAELSMVYAALQSVTARCMSSRGFQYDPLPSPDYSTIVKGREGGRTREQAQQYGFTPTNQSQASVPSSAEERLNSRLNSDASFALALGGPDDKPETGCSSIARTEVYGPEPTYETLLAATQNERAQYRRDFLASPHGQVATNAWVSCMSKSGFDYSSPSAIYEVAWTSPRPSNAERLAAVVNYDCRRASDLDGQTAAYVEASIQLSYEKNPDRAAQMRRVIEAMVARAADSVG